MTTKNDASVRAMISRGLPFWTTHTEKSVSATAGRMGIKVKFARCIAVAVSTREVYDVLRVTPVVLPTHLQKAVASASAAMRQKIASRGVEEV